MAVIIEPTPIENFTPVPPVGEPTFAREAYEFVNKWTGYWIPALNTLAQEIYTNAEAVASVSSGVDAQMTALNAAAAAAVAAASAKLWESGKAYKAATTSIQSDVVINPADMTQTYRCILDVTGSTNPSADPTHWVQLTGLVPPALNEVFVDLGAGVNLDLKAGAVFKKTITANTTFTVSNPAAAGKVSSGILELVNAGSKTVAFWAGTKWSNGLVPIFATSGTDVIGFYTRDGGVSYIMTLIATRPA
ncbi:MAG: hypothetical protein JSR68_08210 [Proteobacteria bacterium]|nr:hypothetical protein [Pseudomonadota bacterium]